jgi:hypothetical protein
MKKRCHLQHTIALTVKRLSIQKMILQDIPVIVCHDQFNTIQSQAPFPTYETYSCEMCERSFDNVEGVERRMQVDYLESEGSHRLEEIMFRKSTEDTQDFTLKNTRQ